MITIEGVSLLHVMFAGEASRRTPVASDGAYKSGASEQLGPQGLIMDTKYGKKAMIGRNKL